MNNPEDASPSAFDINVQTADKSLTGMSRWESD